MGVREHRSRLLSVRPALSLTFSDREDYPMEDALPRMQQFLEAMFPKVLGMKLLEVTPDRVRAELTVTPDLCTVNGVLHGGAAMTMADFLGAAGTSLNLPAGAGTTTLESKTNFLAAATVGQRIEAT